MENQTGNAEEETSISYQMLLRTLFSQRRVYHLSPEYAHVNILVRKGLAVIREKGEDANGGYSLVSASWAGVSSCSHLPKQD